MENDVFYLRFFTQEDAFALLAFELRNREYFKQFTFLKSDEYYTIENIKIVIDRYIRLKNHQEMDRFGIFLKSDDTLIGMIALNDILPPLKSAYVGYQIDQVYANRGYTTKALALIIDYAFNTLDLHRLEAGVMPANVGSIKVLERNGFIKEGLVRKNVKINGKWEDHYLYGLLNPKDELFVE
jgi:ribosomal-protein-alanine N-acetyltransferase